MYFLSLGVKGLKGILFSSFFSSHQRKEQQRYMYSIGQYKMMSIYWLMYVD